MRSRLLLILVLHIVVLLAVLGCKKRSKDDDDGPEISSINLANACTAVPYNTNLIVRFNESVNSDTLATNTENTSCSGSIQLSEDEFATCIKMLSEPALDADGKTMTVALADTLDYQRTYKVRVINTVEDSNDNKMDNSFETSNGFQIESDPGNNKVFWTAVNGTSSYEYGKALSVDTGNSIVLAGKTNGEFSGQTASGGSDIFFIRYDVPGTPTSTVGVVQFGSDGDDYAEGVATDNSNNIYITGKAEGKLNSQTHNGSGDYFISKYSSAGSHVWTAQAGTSSEDWAFAIATDSSSNSYITGKTSGTLSGQSSSGSDDAFVAKYNGSGSLVWLSQIGSSGYDAGYGIDLDSDGNVYVIGITTGSIAGHSGKHDIFVLKYNNSGTLQWKKQFGTSDDDYGRAITVDSSNNIYLAANTYGEMTGDSQGSSDIVIMKLSSQGDVTWTIQTGTAKRDLAKSIQLDSSNNVYITGTSESFFPCMGHFGLKDIFLAKYSSDGSKEWIRQVGSVALDYGKALAIDSSNNIYLAGWTEGTIDFKPNSGATDYVILKYNSSGTRF